LIQVPANTDSGRQEVPRVLSYAENCVPSERPPKAMQTKVTSEQGVK
jgi:hypothetical protein